MAISLYDLSVASFLQTLGGVAGFLQRGLDHCRDNNIADQTRFSRERSRAMQELGFIPKRPRIDGKPTRGFMKHNKNDSGIDAASEKQIVVETAMERGMREVRETGTHTENLYGPLTIRLIDRKPE
jgi:hypothetical protein